MLPFEVKTQSSKNQIIPCSRMITMSFHQLFRYSTISLKIQTLLIATLLNLTEKSHLVAWWFCGHPFIKTRFLNSSWKTTHCNVWRQGLWMVPFDLHPKWFLVVLMWQKMDEYVLSHSIYTLSRHGLWDLCWRACVYPNTGQSLSSAECLSSQHSCTF